MKKHYFLVTILSFTMISMNAQFVDDMESYTDGSRIYEGHWTDWNSTGDAAIWSSSTQAHEGSLSGYIWGDPITDLVDGVLDLGNKLFGQWGLSFWMYVTPEKKAYYNYQGTVPVAGGAWIVGNIFFNRFGDTPGEGYVDFGPQTPEDVWRTFTYPEGEWFRVITNVDISSGIEFSTFQLIVNGVEVVEEGHPFASWINNEWNYDNTLSLGGVDFYSNDADHDYFVDTFLYQLGFIIMGSADFESTGFRSALSNNILTLVANEEISSVSIYNMLGQEVYRSSTNTSSINMSSYANGTYIVKVNINDIEGTVKIVK